MNLAHILKKPLVTEKTLKETKYNRYAFIVDFAATKSQIATAVEEVFEVAVVSVRTSVIKSVKRRTGKKRLPSTTNRFKKAMVEIKEGQTIGAFEVQG